MDAYIEYKIRVKYDIHRWNDDSISIQEMLNSMPPRWFPGKIRIACTEQISNKNNPYRRWTCVETPFDVSPEEYHESWVNLIDVYIMNWESK